MKKILVILIGLLCNLFIGAAQLQVSYSESDAPETLLTLMPNPGQFTSLECFHGNFYISSNTTNQFDDDFLLQLGSSKESARQTILDLKELLDNRVNYTQLSDGTVITYRRQLGIGFLVLQQKGQAGEVGFYKSTLNKMLACLTDETLEGE